jgi:hypothetical protein
MYPDNVSLIEFDHEAYASWLNDREDSEIMRSQWAALRG